MAKISLSDQAPSGEAVTFSFAGAGFTLKGNETYESAAPAVVRAAESHPWLAVEHDKRALIRGTYRDQIRPEDDPMSAVNDRSFDLDAIEAEEAAKAVEFGTPVAIDAALDQDKRVVTGGVAETLAADPTTDTPKRGKKETE